MLIPDSGVSNVMKSAYRIPTRYGEYADHAARLALVRMAVIKTKEIIASPAKAPAFPKMPGTVTA